VLEALGSSPATSGPGDGDGDGEILGEVQKHGDHTGNPSKNQRQRYLQIIYFYHPSIMKIR
jgi:hypothetical protein